MVSEKNMAVSIFAGSRASCLYFSMLLAICVGSLHAQQDEYEQWKKQEEGKYQQYVEERDKEFVAFLKHEWKQMQVMNGLVPDESPKPAELPIYKPSKGVAEVAAESAKTVVRLPDIKALQEGTPRAAEQPRIDPEKNFSHAKFLFYGLPLDISYDSAIKCSLPLPVDKEGISGFWERLSRSNFTDLLKQTTFRKGEMNLNDWGVLELVHAIGKEIYQAENEAILFTWFLSLKCGFDTKAGFSGDQVCLLVPTDNTLYGVLFLTLNKTKQRYYVVSLDPNWKLKDEQIFTYEGSYPKAEGVVKFLLKAPPAIEHMSSSKTLKFSYAGQEHLIPIKFSKDAVRFLEYYPQTNFEVYFNAAASSEATTSLVSALRPLVEGKTEREAVNILLRFVQTAFRYKTDPEQFGREKPLFPDETLHYDYSDCEDRAILFAYLLRTLTGLKVIGLDFPGHIATAVKFTDEIPGDALTYQGKKFVICDPTYENADVGCCMPNFKGVAPKIISID